MRQALSLAALLLWGAAGAAAEEATAIQLKPDQGPLPFTKVEKPPLLEAVFPIAPTERRSFTASMKVDVYTWSHYGGVRAGFKNVQFAVSSEAGAGTATSGRS